MRSFDFVFAWAVVIAVYVLQPKSHFLFNCLCGHDAVSFKKSICIWKRKRDRVENVTTRWRSCWLRNLCRLSSWVILRFKKSENRFGRYFMCVTLLEFDFWHWLSAIHPHTQTKLVIPAGHSVVHTHRVAEKKNEIWSETFFPTTRQGSNVHCGLESEDLNQVSTEKFHSKTWRVHSRGDEPSSGSSGWCQSYCRMHESIIMAATSPLVVIFVFLAWQSVLSLYYERWLLLGHSTADHGVFNISLRSCVILGSSNS
jgi:hypothetical protein